MKNILFIIRDFRQGGIPRCLQSLLALLDNTKYHCDLLCLHQDGPYKDAMPNCNILPQDKTLYRLLAFTKDVNTPPQQLTHIKHLTFS